MPVPKDFQDLLPKPSIESPYEGPIYFLWSFNPQNAKVTLVHNDDIPPAHHKTHSEIDPENVNPGRLNGYAYKIRGGYRITDDEGHPVDPFVSKRVLTLLRGHEPKDPLPHIPYHHKESY
jgi:hypothetical protein